MNEDKKTHLDEVVFNATEFATGNLFLFKNKRTMGNGTFRVPKELKGDIRLSDIIAASSCFPGGFEPLAFPGDFIAPKQIMDNIKDEEKRERFKEKYAERPSPGMFDNEKLKNWEEEFEQKHRKPSGAIALMDGGICDNQGISSIINSEKNNLTVEKDYYYDLVIISDVASPK